MKMSPAEFRCTREFLGLTGSWVARRLGVDERTERRWEHSRAIAVPENYAVLLSELAAAASRTVSLLTVQWVQQKGNAPLPVPNGDLPESLSEFPPTWHRMIASRVAERIGVGMTYIDQLHTGETK